jgi:acyl-CoA reductase-like NAD-dependent aldehyde dehydrogenase
MPISISRSGALRTRSSSITGSAAALDRASTRTDRRGSGRHRGKIKAGPGLDPSTDMGSLVSDEQFARVTGYIEDGRQSGAKIAVGGGRVGNLGYFVSPTVFENTKPDMKIIT